MADNGLVFVAFGLVAVWAAKWAEVVPVRLAQALAVDSSPGDSSGSLSCDAVEIWSLDFRRAAGECCAYD